MRMGAMTDRRQWPFVASAVALVSVGVRLAYGRGALGYDASFALVWGRQLADGHAPDLDSPLAPTSHPLATLVSAALRVLGDHAVDALLLLAAVAMAALAVGAFVLGS